VNPTQLDPRLGADPADPHALRVVVETPRGSRHKYAYEEESGAYEHRATLASGLVWPYDYGFVPQTLGGDGDPCDVLVLMDDGTFPGCVVEVRLLGAICLVKNGERNDRYVACLRADHETSLSTDGYATLRDVPRKLLDQLENFLTSYSTQAGHDTRVDGNLEAGEALERLRAAQRAWRAKANP
jgi:inorganic pyrophosphatase